MPEMNTTANNKSVAPVEEFWRYAGSSCFQIIGCSILNCMSLYPYELLCSDRVLQTNDGLEHGLGVIQYELMGTLLLGWIIVYGIIR